MDLKVKRGSNIPIYQQITEMIEKKIICGEYPPGSRLPSERKLAEQLDVNRMTISRVYDDFMALGVVERKQGSGTIVTPASLNKLTAGTTDWKAYVEGGALLPTYPLLKQIKKVTNNNNILDLSGNELSPHFLSTSLLNGILKKMDLKQITSYANHQHPQGQIELREAIVSYMHKFYHVNTTSSSIMVTTSIQQSLFLFLQSLLSPGDAIAIESPSYFYSYPLFQSLGLRVYGLPVDEDGIDPEDMIALHRKHRIKFVLLIPTFQNPTGTALSEERRKRIAEISAEIKLPVVEGDPYYTINYEDKLYHPIKDYDTNGNIIYIGSLAKTSSIQIGISWIVGPQMVIEKIIDSQQQTNFGVNIFSQFIGQKLLESKHYSTHLAFLKKDLKGNRDEMMKYLDAVLGADLEYFVPNGGFYIWCKCKHPVDDRKLVEECIKNNVLFMPGSMLGAEQGYIRINFASIRKEDIQKAISRLAVSLKNII